MYSSIMVMHSRYSLFVGGTLWSSQCIMIYTTGWSLTSVELIACGSFRGVCIALCSKLCCGNYLLLEKGVEEMSVKFC